MIDAGDRTIVRIVSSPLQMEPLAAAVTSPECGALVSFAGVVRRDGTAHERSVTALTYEAYEAPALAEFEAIANEARGRFGRCNVAIVQRVGSVPVGEASIAIAVASAHRALAFDVCEYVIDELKSRAPIWKKEHYSDGSANWVENRR